MHIGYEFLRQHLATAAFAFSPVARVSAVTRVSLMGEVLAVPASVAPQGNTVADALAHVLFALKHEGTQLPILAQALPQIAAKDMAEAFHAAPTGAYVRVACYLWEAFTQQTLEVAVGVGRAATAYVFDPQKYITVARARDPKWHVSFNGLGSLDYCPTVRRTPAIQRGMDADILGQANAFVAGLPSVMMDRALAWAYLHETEDSFAIERETPSQARAQAFVELLQQAHAQRDVSEDYLVALQNSVVANPFGKAVQYRTEQNWLRGPGRGVLGISYVPPAPALVAPLMAHVERLANALPSQIDPIVAASVCAFAFVYVHPFMDGNGRLSRFLFHHALCKSGRLASGLILPVSVAMKRRESDYLQCLQTYSKPARAGWQVTWIDEGQYDFEFVGHEANYRYWDATACAEFGFEVAAQALEVELKQEAQFLQRYDRVYALVNEQFDIRNNDLATLVLSAIDNAGVVSKNRRKQFEGRVPAAAFDALESAAHMVLGEQA